MEHNERYCYITYPIPIDEIKDLPFSPYRHNIDESPYEPLPAYPKGFMPEWFKSGSFPEDEPV